MKIAEEAIAVRVVPAFMSLLLCLSTFCASVDHSIGAPQV